MNGDVSLTCSPVVVFTIQYRKTYSSVEKTVTDSVTRSSSQLQLLLSNCQHVPDHNSSSIDTPLLYRAIVSYLCKA